MKKLVMVEVLQITNAVNYSKDGEKTDKKTKSGLQVYDLHHKVESEKEINGEVYKSVNIEKMSSEVKVDKPGKYVFEVTQFVFNSNIYNRAIAVISAGDVTAFLKEETVPIKK